MNIKAIHIQVCRHRLLQFSTALQDYDSHRYIKVISLLSSCMLIRLDLSGYKIELKIAKTPVTSGKPFDVTCAVDFGDKSHVEKHSSRAISHATMACGK